VSNSYNNESRSEQDLKKKNRIKEKPGRKEEIWLTKGILIDKELYKVEEMDNINTFLNFYLLCDKKERDFYLATIDII
jgi:hypothetical protein